MPLVTALVLRGPCLLGGDGSIVQEGSSVIAKGASGSEAVRLDLPDGLTRHRELMANLFERVVGVLAVGRGAWGARVPVAG